MLINTESLDEGDLKFSSADRWIRSRFNNATTDMQKHLTNYRLDLALQSAYEFTWHEFCDWYLELSKPILQSDNIPDAEKRGTRKTLIEVLEATLRLLHPLMPFITEEIWQTVALRANLEGETIMLRPFPKALSEAADDKAVEDIEWVKQFILGVRQIRGEMDISPGKLLPVILQDASATDLSRIKSQELLLERVGRVESVTSLKDEKPPAAATAFLGDMRMLVPMKGLIDIKTERARLKKQREKINLDLQRSAGKLNNKKFINNAPAQIIAQEQQRVIEFERVIKQLTEQLEKLNELT